MFKTASAGVNPVRAAATFGGLGALAGAAYGAATEEKGHRLRGALTGAGIGGISGVGGIALGRALA